MSEHPTNTAATPAVPALTPEQLATMTPEQKDAWWLANVYQGDRMPQLTWRAVLMGGFLGMLMSAANLYTTLAIGWAFGIAITACVLSFVIWNFVILVSGKRVSQMSVLENACMASTASAAGYSTGSTIATMFGSLVLLAEIPEGKTAKDIYTWDITPPWVVVTFTLCTGLMGVFLAIPMKRQQINYEQLPFPTGTAAAETLRSLYSKSAEALEKAYILVIGLAAGLLIGFLRAGDDVLDKVGFLRKFFDTIRFRIPAEIELHVIDRLYPGSRHAAGFAFEPSALLIAAGMIVGMRISLSLVLSSLLLYGVVAPKLAEVDAARMERGAVAVMQAADQASTPELDAAKAANRAPDAANLLTATIDAIEKAAVAERLDGAAIAAAARRAGEGVIKGDAEARAKAAADAAKATPPLPAPPAPTVDEQRGLAAAAVTAARNAAAPVAATAYSNRDALAAATAAKAAALAKGATEADAQTEYNKVWDEQRYRPIFIWNWGGNAIVLTRWALWGGTSVMVFASLMSVALQWRTIVRAFKGSKGGSSSAGSDIEVPGSWMIMGMLPITIAMVWLQWQAFSVSWYWGLLAVGMSFVLSMVASRATGETDTTPIGAMGKVMQLLFAVLHPGQVGPNLASAGIAANSASSSADLLTDLKTGYLLGANPRKQFIAQFFGCFFGTVAIVPIWYLMVPTREKLESFALPATRSWEAVARVLTKGIRELPESAVYAIFIGAAVGCILPLIEKFLSPKARRFMPSATGIGLAWVMPFQNAFSFFVGACIIMLWMRLSRKTADKYNIAVASGLIAGESLMAAALAITATVVGLLGLGI